MGKGYKRIKVKDVGNELDDVKKYAKDNNLDDCYLLIKVIEGKEICFEAFYCKYTCIIPCKILLKDIFLRPELMRCNILFKEDEQCFIIDIYKEIIKLDKIISNEYKKLYMESVYSENISKLFSFKNAIQVIDGVLKITKGITRENNGSDSIVLPDNVNEIWQSSFLDKNFKEGKIWGIKNINFGKNIKYLDIHFDRNLLHTFSNGLEQTLKYSTENRNVMNLISKNIADSEKLSFARFTFNIRFTRLKGRYKCSGLNLYGEIYDSQTSKLSNVKRVLVIKPEWNINNLFEIAKNMVRFKISYDEEDRNITFQIYINYRLFCDRFNKDKYNEKLGNLSNLCMNYFEEVIRKLLESYFIDEDVVKALTNKFLDLVNGNILNNSNEYIISVNNIFNGYDDERYWIYN